MTALVIVASTRAAAGVYKDRSGPILVAWLRSKGFDTPDAVIVADADLPAYLDELKYPQVVLISGGTGLTPDDITVDTLLPRLNKEIPGIAHAFWNYSMQAVPTTVLSRTVAGIIGRTFIMALPGSTGAARDAVAVLDPLIDHITGTLQGNHEH
ncbi:MogA/MoaB family molybdenum cofactor biosynthesis protein [Corynebacterium crudilactis]|uniref:Molybdenum cofactor biosynthesis protein n=1 Tax=Corynebacterium crudilactis TaxID=1652495 RepID=A0A172QQJ5_9CORY|nr:MogA/MoaB family molybdenum cofactor biosynthesis protein [Corynebacterium crudilactis]ANE02957.1 molybdenum cofactor biosynthesis protein [Corynebacterium crudilactis]